jgi:23S rRNA U2552 (ribose-2'-O)-methylase RlmE/FtsJ
MSFKKIHIMCIKDVEFEDTVKTFFKPVWEKNFPPFFFEDPTYKELRHQKSKIDDDKYNKDWDEKKKYHNAYENIHVSSSKLRRNENIAFYIPLSRSYFKLWEIIYDFHIISSDIQPWKSAHLAEGPGGFIEAVCKYREVNKLRRNTDKHYGITLRSTKKEIPGWNKAQYFLKQFEQVEIHYGEDDTGNLYEAKNILSFSKHVGMHSCNLVTADGGFDFSIDFNHQENLSGRLIFAEIIASLLLLKEGGTFVCKVFDTYERFSVEMIWILTNCFDKVIFTKPFTSRPANSEKYVVCLGYKLVSTEITDCFLELLNKYEEDKYLQCIFPSLVFDPNFLQSIQEYNTIHTHNQLQAIKDTLYYIEQTEEQDYEKLLKDHVNTCIRWCFKYKVPINRQCKYISYIDKKYLHFLGIKKNE